VNALQQQRNSISRNSSFSPHDKRHQHHCTLLLQPNSEKDRASGATLPFLTSTNFQRRDKKKKKKKKERKKKNRKNIYMKKKDDTLA